MLKRLAYERAPPATWSELLADLRAFVDPLVNDPGGGLRSWTPEEQVWMRSAH